MWGRKSQTLVTLYPRNQKNLCMIFSSPSFEQYFMQAENTSISYPMSSDWNSFTEIKMVIYHLYQLRIYNFE